MTATQWTIAALVTAFGAAGLGQPLIRRATEHRHTRARRTFTNVARSPLGRRHQ